VTLPNSVQDQYLPVDVIYLPLYLGRQRSALVGSLPNRRLGRPLPVHQANQSRWKVERSHRWLDNWWRLVTRYDWYTESYITFLTIACFMLTLARILQ
jgi:hypothetical protein